PPRLTREQIKAWAQEHYTRNKKYPAADSGAIPGTACETWQAINLALWIGRRGLPGGSSLAQFLEEEFGRRNRMNLPHLTREQIREWVIAWHARTGRYPTRQDGEIPETNGETWAALDDTLRIGRRGLSRGSSLPKFLEKEFGVRNRLNPIQITTGQIK